MDAPQTTPTKKPLTAAQEEYVAFLALGGIIPDENNPAGRRITGGELAVRLNVDRKTMWRWRQTIPDFWDLVSAKRRELGSKDRLSNVWNGVYLRAVAGNADAAKLYLANFDPSFVMPSQNVKHELGESWAQLLRGKDLSPHVIEGKVVDGHQQQD